VGISNLNRRRFSQIGLTSAVASILNATGAVSKLDAQTRPASGADHLVNIGDFGAISDGKTLNTAPIQRAIDTCATAGGGTVLIQNGRYLTGTLFLKSNVTLRIEAGAALVGSSEISEYSINTFHNMYSNSTHMDRCLIFARNAVNIALEGKGVIDGQGASFPKHDDPKRNRPILLRFLDCQGISIKDLTLLNPASWTTSFLYCADVIVDGVNILSWANSAGDGLDFDGCQNVRIANCSLDNSDDSIAFQTSREDKPTKNVVVTNCIIKSKWAAVALGPLSRGAFENITVSNCAIHDVQGEALKIQLVEGGVMNNVSFSALVMTNVARPVFVTFCRRPYLLDSPAEPPEMRSLKNVIFSNIRVDGGDIGPESRNSFIAVIGLPEHPVENFTFSNIHFTAVGGGTKEDARRAIPELVGIAPEHGPLGPALPAYGFYGRHVKGLTLNGIRLETKTKDLRPAIVFDDATDVYLAAVQVQGDLEAESLIRFQNTKGAFIQGSGPFAETETLLRVEGSQSSGIVLAANFLHHVKSPVFCGTEVPKDAVENHDLPRSRRSDS
jgi:hypothetical protein